MFLDPFAGGGRRDTVLTFVAIVAQHGKQRKYLDGMISMLPGN